MPLEPAPDADFMSPYGLTDSGERFTAHMDELVERARTRELAGPDLATQLASAPDLNHVDLSGVDLDGADLSGLSLLKANLRGASLRNAILTRTELSGADLEGANLEGATLTEAGLGMSNLKDVNAFGADLTGATLTGADLTGSVLGCSTLAGARLRDARLTSADLRSADLRGAELSQCDVTEANFDEADLRGARLRAIAGFESAHWYGTDIRDINFAGAYRLRRHVIDENYLREFRESGTLQRWIHNVWWVTSDCGRSLARWTGFIAVVVVVFAALYGAAGVNLGANAPGALSHLYYSVVTLTSLGYGDITPTSALGQILVIMEVCVGYMMLGGLISILANKMARRGE